MNQNQYRNPVYSKKRCAAVAALILCFGVTGQILGLSAIFDRHISEPLGFTLRQLTKNAPPVSDNLVIIGMDDIAVASQQVTELNLKSWAFVLEGIASFNPKTIIIDKLFNSPMRPQQPELFVEQVRKLSAPVIAGAMVSTTEIEGRPRLDVNRPEFRREKYGRDLSAQEEEIISAGRFSYGPNPAFGEAFSALGHIQLDEHQRIEAFQQVDEKNAIPHIAFLAADSLQSTEGGLMINDIFVDLDRRGQFLINFVDPDAIRKKVIRLDTAIDAIVKKEPIPGLKAGDTVLVLPGLYTGGGDIKQTPLGKLPGGYLQASVINSVLTGRWVHHTSLATEVLLLLLISIVTGLIGYRFSPSMTLISTGVLILTLIGIGILFFTTKDLNLSWAHLSLNAGLAGGSQAFEKARSIAGRAEAIGDALGGKVSPKEIEDLLRNPQQLDLTPRSETVTLMFIDLVGFSKLAEGLPAPELFSQLKTVLQDIRKTIYEHGGYIDRTLGDGLLCYFGFKYAGSTTNTDYHADQALLCATAIQKNNLLANQKALKEGKTSYPLRIGINTDQVCMGDLGDENRIDFTAIGHGVNYAKRLESACGYYRIMISSSTRGLLTNKFWAKEDSSRMFRRLIQIKHHTDLKEAYEYDPVPSSSEATLTVMRYFWSLIGLNRGDDRFPVADIHNIRVSGKYVKGEIRNFSESGMALILDEYIADGASISFDIDDGTGALASHLRSKGLLPLTAEIRWGVPQDNKYLHGAALRGISAEGMAQIFLSLSNYKPPETA